MKRHCKSVPVRVLSASIHAVLRVDSITRLQERFKKFFAGFPVNMDFQHEKNLLWIW